MLAPACASAMHEHYLEIVLILYAIFPIQPMLEEISVEEFYQIYIYVSRLSHDCCKNISDGSFVGSDQHTTGH